MIIVAHVHAAIKHYVPAAHRDDDARPADVLAGT